MSYLIYLSLKGKKQGLISAGCSTPESIGNRYQAGREDEIQVLHLSHMMTRDQNVNHLPVSFTKPIDKSSPLLGLAIDKNELLDALFKCYRVNLAGQLEFFYEIKLTGATIVDFSCHYPHSIDDNDQIPYETVQLDYKSMSFTHRAAGTTGYAISQLQGREEERPLLSGFSSLIKPLETAIEALFSKKFTLKNEVTGDNCCHVAYGINTAKGLKKGISKETGITDTINSKEEEDLEVEYLYQTKIGMKK
ncbi:putative Haemolysin co-regulated protein (putative Hcp) [Xenorhabdus doucetiae]|uniref:Putative Haemolysin co-regulated protein (Putative Hcp) n=1 Tax=Xenorhabdus doucetiae TaxID=351671 RepID=A0A068QVX1_9GAMM|nr:hypothetical protein LY16_03500 [Xenorhabdus doucetiae]CDG18939.1 putative Haemolysin co-regulated protein (putative Hcp) [Xenorhabdus doucetiae]